MRICKLTRYAYFDELAKDPDVKQLMDKQISSAWIHCKDSIDDHLWSDSFADQFNNGEKSTRFDFSKISTTRWFELESDRLSINNLVQIRALGPASGWDVYINTELNAVFVIEDTQLEGTGTDRILAFIERNLKSPNRIINIKDLK